MRENHQIKSLFSHLSRLMYNFYNCAFSKLMYHCYNYVICVLTVRFRQTNMFNFGKGNLIVETRCITNVMHKQKKKNCVELILNLMNERL